jgi:hypothetical protein
MVAAIYLIFVLVSDCKKVNNIYFSACVMLIENKSLNAQYLEIL